MYGIIELADYLKWEKRRKNAVLTPDVLSSLHMLVVGGGSAGQRHLSNLLGLGVTNVAVVEPRADRQADIRSHYGDVQLFATEDEAYAASTYTAVVVANPPAFHLKSGNNAIAHGADVLMEKSISNTLEGVEEFLAAAEKAGKVVGICYISRFFDTLQHIKTLVDNGTLGRVISVQINSSEYLPDWHPWEKPNEWYAGQRALGGDVLVDENHTVDFARWLFGEITSVTGFVTSTGSLPANVDIIDFAEFTYTHESGTVSHIHQDAFGRKGRKDMIIMGEKGNLYWDSYMGGNKVEYFNAETKTTETIPGKVTRADAFFELMRDFVEALVTGKQPFITGRDGFKTLKATVAAEQSSKEGRRLEIK